MSEPEVFGEHVIAASASRVAGTGRGGRWEFRMSALPRGSEPDTPLLRFPVAELNQDDPVGALAAALGEVRRILSDTAATRKS